MKKKFRCKFIAGDGAYKYLDFVCQGSHPPHEYYFSVFKPLKLSYTKEVSLEELSLSSSKRKYQLEGMEGKTWIYREQ